MDDYEAALASGNAAALQAMAQADGGRLPTNRYGLGPLHFAVSMRFERNQAANVRALLDGGAEVDARTLDGRTPLHLATMVAAPILVTAGADVGARTKDGSVPLHLNPQPALLGPGVDVDVRNDYGMTPLHFAALEADADGVKWLLAAGADPGLATTKTYPHYEGVLAEQFDPLIEFSAGARPFDIAKQQFDRTKWSTGEYRPVYELLDAVTPRRSLLRR